MEVFSHLPTDIYQEILYHLTLPDTVSLLQTCVAFFSSRSLWYQALEQACDSYSLPCPLNQDISLLDLSQLQKLGAKARSLHVNLAKERPIYKSVARFDLSAGLVIVAVIHGTRIILTQGIKTTDLHCWDLAETRPTLIGTIPNVKLVVCSAPYIIEQKFVLAIISKSHRERVQNRASVVIVSIDYTNRSHVKFTETFRRQVALRDPRLHVAMHSPTQGVLAAFDPVLACPLLAPFDTTTETDPDSLITLTPVPLETPLLAVGFIQLYASGETYYMRIELRTRKVVFAYFPFDDYSIRPESISRLETVDGLFGSTTLCNANVTRVQCVSRRAQFMNEIDGDPHGPGRLVDDVQQELTLTFWLPGTEHYSFTFNIESSRFHSQVFWLSGPSLLLVLYRPSLDDSYQAEHSFELFRFRREPEISCTRHRLIVPPEIDLTAIALDGIAGRFEWDDRLGIVYTILHGVVTAIAYA